MHLWKLHRQAVDYGQDPAVLLGIDPLNDSWFAWQVRNAVHDFGSWFQAKRESTKEVPVPKGKREQKMRVPRYTDEQLAQMLGLGERPMDAAAQKEIDDLAEQLIAGTVDWSEWDDLESLAN